MSKITIKELPISYNREYLMSIDNIHSTNMNMTINGRSFYISIPKNNSWSHIHLHEGMVCVIKKQHYGDQDQYTKLIFIEIYEQKKDKPYENHKQIIVKKKGVDQYYTLLQCDKDTSFDNIKKNYKALIRQYHYDTLVSKNIPQDMLDYAQDKAKMINEAYEILSKIKCA